MTTNFVQNLIEGERENEEDDKDSITQEELPAVVQQFRKGTGKGESKGKGKGVCWNCVDGDHYSRDCPNDKQDSWTETMSWKGQQDSNQQRFRPRMGQEKATGTAPKEKGKSGNRTENGARRRASLEVWTNEANTASMDLLKVTGGHIQTLQTLKKILISASWNIPKTS